MKPATKGYLYVSIYIMSRTGKPIDTESRFVARGLGKRELGMTTNKYEVSVWGDENILEINSGGCTALWITKNHWSVHL